mmetsp:Transcript_16179/g.48932  ORF Transcript_16179/g.48932 Transcript_16179/m.48932 type:complete len:289 (-) Transcript_16179:1313-2179(-)
MVVETGADAASAFVARGRRRSERSGERPPRLSRHGRRRGPAAPGAPRPHAATGHFDAEAQTAPLSYRFGALLSRRRRPSFLRDRRVVRDTSSSPRHAPAHVFVYKGGDGAVPRGGRRRRRGSGAGAAGTRERPRPPLVATTESRAPGRLLRSHAPALPRPRLRARRLQHRRPRRPRRPRPRRRPHHRPQRLETNEEARDPAFFLLLFLTAVIIRGELLHSSRRRHHIMNAPLTNELAAAAPPTQERSVEESKSETSFWRSWSRSERRLMRWVWPSLARMTSGGSGKEL